MTTLTRREALRIAGLSAVAVAGCPPDELRRPGPGFLGISVSV